jgi:hypothetical protein
MRLISPLQSSELDQVVVITGIFCMIAAYLAVLYTFWRRKTVRWIILIFMLVSIFIAPSFAVAAVLGAIFSKIDTESGNYWAQVLPLEGHKIGYTVYEKDSGRTANFCDGYDYERQAIAAAENFIQHGNEF